MKKKQIIGKALKGKGKAAHGHDVVFTPKFAKEEAKEASHKAKKKR